jgi:hypothetical protein
MEEKSGLELIKELMDKIDNVSKKIDVLDQNIKKIANSAKVSELINKAHESNMGGWSKPKANIEAAKPPETPNGMRFNLEPKDASKLKSGQLNKPKMIMVSGKIITNMNDKAVFLPGITVKIYDKTNKLIKETKTNAGGQWRAGLGAGKYVAEFSGKYKDNELTPINKVFEVPDGVSEYEVNI